MSSSRHPVALVLERRVGGSARLLAMVMVLPLVDGVFAALVLAGALDSALGVVQVGLLVFGGSATLAVLLADVDGSPRTNARRVLLIGGPLVALAMVEAAFAPTVASAIDLPLFERFAGVVLLAIAARTVSARVGEWIPSPGAVIALGLLASVRPASATLVFTPDAALVARAGAAALVGVGFALAVVLLQHPLRRILDIDRFRFGSAIALGTLALSVVHVLPAGTPFPLAVLALAGLFAFDPDADAEAERESVDPGAADTERLPWM